METAILIILAVVIGSFLYYLNRRDVEDRKERGKLLNAILAKNAGEHMNLQAVDQAEGSTQEEPQDRFEDTSTLSDEEYLRMETQGLDNK